MDHLPLPPGRKEHLRVGFFARRSVYKPGEFFILPQQQVHCEIRSLLQSGLPRHIDAQSANEFLQSWLFFGLLAQVLHQDINANNFIDPKPRTIHTRRLPDILEEWSKRQNAIISSIDANDDSMSHYSTQWLIASKALDIAKRFISQHDFIQPLSHRWPREKSFITPSPIAASCVIVDEKMIFSIAILGEALEQRRREVYMNLRHGSQYIEHTIGQNYVAWSYSSILRDEMLKRGWCLAQIARLESTCRLSAVYFLYSLKNMNVPSYVHGQCTSTNCKAALAQRGPLHRRCDGNCDQFYLQVQDGEVETWIKRGLTPLVTWDSEAGLVVKPYKLSTMSVKFGALSHSWDEGLIAFGNDARGSNNRMMHACQIMSLQRTFDEFAKQDSKSSDISGNQNNVKIPFWVDILCMPRSNEAKAIAINQLKEIYSLAKHVVVWDRGLLQAGKSVDLINICSRIKLGDWYRRLWALQETIVAKPRTLCFEIQDGSIVRLDDLVSVFHNAQIDPASAYHYCWEAISAISPEVLRQRQLVHEDLAACAEEAVRNLWCAIRHRLVGHAEDETIVIANILGLDVSHLQVNETPHLGIPADIIFLPQGKQKLSGCQWAPRSWLDKGRWASPISFRPSRNVQTAYIMKSGLLVSFFGFSIQLPSQRHPSSPGPQQIKFKLRLLTTAVKWFALVLEPEDCSESTMQRPLGGDNHLYLILSCEPKVR
ncbi:hypothetical protein OIDMADRAFT_34185 [Oidiodendron maius Zn]|uniref:Heterokaryon incompatibility domain-containing protein n=1 Tax=Oidiodendron maius (strain Zn) TaxID=913774 RepID=A0A0C3GYU1_OIDMZ|nr:hypothetical protein OIDMADRAFT_34185 [Oidiodendron maius Zn]